MIKFPITWKRRQLSYNSNPEAIREKTDIFNYVRIKNFF